MPYQGYDPTGRLAKLSPQERLKYLSTQPGYTWIDPDAKGSGYWDRVVGAMARGGASPAVNLERMSIAGNEMSGYSGIDEAAQENLDAERMWRQNVDPWKGPRGETFEDEADRFAGPGRVRDLYLRRAAGYYSPRRR